jgi:cysteine desulfurase family protein
VDRYLRENGAPAGRSGYAEAIEAAAVISSARVAVARLIGSANPRQIVFTTNGTDSLNLTIHGFLRPGDHAICTDADHNSVLRPLRALEQNGQIEVTRVRCDSTGLVEPDDIRQAMRASTRLVAVLQASNVTGVVEPIAVIGQICRGNGARMLVDAAQSLGHIPISVEELGTDFLAAPAHKGLLGPLGTGILYIRPGLETELRSARQGGTGTQSEDDRQPRSLPDKYESGNHNVPGLVGLAAAMKWIESRGLDEICRHEQELAARLREGLRNLNGVTVHGIDARVALNNAAQSPAGVGVVSISIEGYDPQEAAALLDSQFGVQVRAGLHCAPNIHRAMGTLERGGTIRFSIGPFNTIEEINAAVAAVREISGG